MNISVLSPDNEFFTGEIDSVKVPGISGEFEVLRNHAPIVSALNAGSVSIRKKDGDTLVFKIKRGFIEVLSNEVSLLVQGIQE